MPPKLRFNDGEKVLCFHGPLLYEAKCIKSQIKDKNVKYFIHYSGWNKNWDEWVPESRVLKYNDANMQKQKELEAAHGKGKKSKMVKNAIKKDSADKESTSAPDKGLKQKTKDAVLSLPSPAEPQPDQPRKKRNRTEQNVENEEEYVQKMEIKVRIPDELKHWLVDDCNQINNQQKLFQLPARVTVDMILSDYVRQRTSVKGISINKVSGIIEAANGIREYFNVMLRNQLLYPVERAQHAEFMAVKKYSELLPSQLYGAIHLLRLFCKIGGSLAYTSLNEECVTVLTSHLYDFMKYLAKSPTPLFSLNDYANASSEYLKKAGVPSVKQEHPSKKANVQRPGSSEHPKKTSSSSVKQENPA